MLLLGWIGIDADDAVDIAAEAYTDNGWQIVFLRSTDGGNTFSNPLQVSDDKLCPQLTNVGLENGGSADIIWEEFEPGCDSTPNQVLFSRGILPNFIIGAAPPVESVLPGGAASFTVALIPSGRSRTP